MEADGSESLIKSEMDSGRNMNNSNNNALGAVGVSIPFPEDLLGVPQDSLNGAGAGPASQGVPNYPQAGIPGAAPSSSGVSPATGNVNANGHRDSSGQTPVQGGQISQNVNYHPAGIQGSAAELNFGNGPSLAEETSKYIHSRMANQNFAMFPSYMQTHSLMDPSIQESLSPFFQPFGVDASHFPMTNPPIFQSALATDSFNPRRRRISISNGQIGQLGEDEDNVESIYYSQPPPMPPLRPNQMQNNNTRVKVEINGEDSLGLNQNNGSDNNKQSSTNLFPSRLSFQELQEESKVLDNVIDPSNPRVSNGGNQRQSVAMSKQMSETSSIKSSNSAMSTEKHVLPGTAAWKRARLLERNRIAASKCRQRKKIAQEQLQKDATVLRNSNRIMKTKLEYYQKLVSKFKRYIELHMQSCGGNNDGLTIIEDMLKIDHDLHQDEHGNLVNSNKN
ncbi:Cst6p [Kluyveromyces lactis]|uniref:KLLA0E04269p n=1 Tax=Kluyveromyces lactis (strain ATCC 8585 / CBS 2359 / DSM 70799 / NBRC 1267 / NRRL Y-1140 / WM37) TaxID=284590 RepID=Q6CPK2_KLULA|nr:uncharacterized protein KLLA0_E04269g [Kluyveromyces lactis]CAG99224.1 KLLA0E04269p [Kluyveromyces lactis]|eukprot:XP_454137.1 uncharacterized protein KLLA0_E04269g [Kluyveromyces lactis]